METAINTIIGALVLSSMYILVALGFALLLSIMGVLNFAHGAIYMVGGYICYQFAVEFGLNQWLSLLLSTIIMGAFGVLLERFCFRPFYGDMYRTIVMTIAIVLVLETTVNVLVGVHIRSLPAFVPGIIKAGAISLSAERLVTFFIGGVLLLGLTWFIRKARAGQQMLAVAQEPEGAALQGIDIFRISAVACAMGCALAAVAGSLMGAIFELSPFMGDYMLVKAIQLVILSGIGSIGGVLVGGLIVGSIDAVLPLFASGAVAQAVGLGIIIVLLLLRPQGLFGREVT
jgi:branched-chain amino acid transport system permease protein